MDDERVILCASSKYEEKYYLNPEFEGLPQGIKDELQAMCVLFTEDIGGILTMEFDENANLQFVTMSDENDILYDEIGSVLKIKQLRNTRRELLESLEMYYKVFFLGQEIAEVE
ncbi:MAG: DUF6145 family protein [Lachnospiraceae bacterium]|nr:DUF6145 family protein [Lachnospiraceae bacterium]HCJ07174.1 hypothetical protein [Lachnospiraceae bacterium]